MKYLQADLPTHNCCTIGFWGGEVLDSRRYDDLLPKEETMVMDPTKHNMVMRFGMASVNEAAGSA